MESIRYAQVFYILVACFKSKFALTYRIKGIRCFLFEMITYHLHLFLFLHLLSYLQCRSRKGVFYNKFISVLLPSWCHRLIDFHFIQLESLFQCLCYHFSQICGLSYVRRLYCINDTELFFQTVFEIVVYWNKHKRKTICLWLRVKLCQLINYRQLEIQLSISM